MKIQTNTAANFALRNIGVNSSNTERQIQKLSSGFRINRAGDDAAGLAIANKLRAEGRSLGQAQKNTAQGSAMLQVMDGATQTVASVLDRMKELATQANSANIGDQKDKLQNEFNQLRQEIGRIANTTQYQGTKLVDGSFGQKLAAAGNTLLGAGTGVTKATVSGAPTGTISFADNSAAGPPQTGGITATFTDAGGNVTSQTITGTAANKSLNFDKLGVTIELGASYALGNADGNLVVEGGNAKFQVSSSAAYGNSTNGDLISVSAVDLNTTATGLDLDGLDLNQAADATTGAQAALGKLDTAIQKVNTALGNIGSAQSRFDFAAANVATTLQNTQAAESTIRDADMAYEMTQFTKSNILSQAAQSMLSQANQGTQGILQLLR
jgi:flagellin